ncbi:nuclear pore complex protein Nup50-like isoform X2 [Limulus polyphemus]|uniref:Nuclear pore complex protein Nup50-like isoform X2 n=1 Tax=Limulus polyphemus TaxID=6850 RepID=A0ABM1SCI3_LIMPO|nr:nuclear pore complex protein Nup50-like isoform X2 [Limulus polyphemus]
MCFNRQKRATSSANSFSRFGGYGVELMPSVTVTIRFLSYTNSSIGLTNSTDLSQKSSSIEEECSKDGNTIPPPLITSKLPQDSKPCVRENKQFSRDIQYYKLLKTLNENFSEWIKNCLGKSPYCNFIPAFEDYENYVTEIEKKYPVQNSQTETTNVREGTLSGIQFSSKSTIDGHVTKHTFNSGSKATKTEGPKKENAVTFKLFPPVSSTTSTSTSSFGFKPTSSPTNSVSGKSLFSLDNDEASSSASITNVLTSTTPSSAGFSFKTCDGSTTSDRVSKPPPVLLTTKKCAVQELREAAPHKIKYSQAEGNDALFSKRCKLFCKKGNCYKDEGIGILCIKMVQGKSRLLIRADSNLDNILLNIRLNSTVPIKKVGKNNVLIVCNPNPPMDIKSSNTETITFLIRVKTSEEADELLLKLNHFKT